jgi:NarL family two-component system response regulator YdfI
MIRLLVVALSPVVRAGLETLAASSPEVRLAGSFPDFTGIEDLPADVVLAAVPLEEIPLAGGAAPVVLITNDAQPVWTIETLRAGVRALLPRDAPQAQILAAVDAAASGLAAIEPRDLDALLLSAAPVPAAAETSALTAREVEVLRMIAEGAPNKIIAWKLGISEHTVKFHVTSILGKLGAASRTEAVTLGIRRGLVMV